jgi:hypothetical protein
LVAKAERLAAGEAVDLLPEIERRALEASRAAERAAASLAADAAPTPLPDAERLPLGDALEALAVALRAMNLDALGAFERLERQHSVSIPGGLDELGRAVQALDFDGALRLCAALRRRLDIAEPLDRTAS